MIFTVRRTNAHAALLWARLSLCLPCYTGLAAVKERERVEQCRGCKEGVSFTFHDWVVTNKSHLLEFFWTRFIKLNKKIIILHEKIFLKFKFSLNLEWLSRTFFRSKILFWFLKNPKASDGGYKLGSDEKLLIENINYFFSKTMLRT